MAFPCALSSQKLSPSQFLGTNIKLSASACPQQSSAQPVVRVVAKKEIKGTVVKTINDKTAAVDVPRIYAHPIYKKRIRSVKRYHAHDPENRCKVGDIVTLAKCAPVSKTKTFLVVKVESARVAGAAAAAARSDAAKAEQEAQGEAEGAEEGPSAGELPPLESEVQSSS